MAEPLSEEEAQASLVAVLMRRWGVEESDEAAFDAAQADVDAILAAHDALAGRVSPGEMGKRWSAERMRECLDAAAAAAGNEWMVVFRSDDWLPGGASDWRSLGRHLSPKHLTEVLRGAEEAGHSVAHHPAHLTFDELWRIVPDEEGAA